MQNNTFSTLFVGQNLIKLSAVDSTNNFLKNLVSKSEPLPEGTVIMAEDQYAGRGQQENAWHAEPGKNLTFSLLLRPSFLPISKQYLLNMAICIAINEALAVYVPHGLKIKWPNDVYYGNQKLGGILIENTIVGNAIKTAVVGIGLNVNQRGFDTQLAGRATSLALILQEDVNLIKLLAELCSHIEYVYLRLKAGDHTTISEKYAKRLYRLGTSAKYRSRDEVFEAEIIGVNLQGQLQVEREGKLLEFNFKEIEFLQDS